MARRGETSGLPVRRRHQWHSVLAERNEAVVPVGAWVESARDHPEEHKPVFITAREVEEQQKEIHKAKMENLKRFQDDVKQRVTEYAQIHKKHQRQRTCEAVEKDDRVIIQSAASAEQLVPNKNTSLLHSHDVGFAIFSPSSKSVSAQGISNEKEDDADAFSDQARQLSKVTKEARRRLASCQTVPEMDFNSTLPGGVWKVSPARDLSKVTKEARHQLASCQTEPEMDLNSNPLGAVLKVSPSGDLSKVTKEARHQLASCHTEPEMDLNSNPPGAVLKVSPSGDLSKVTKEAQHQLASCQTVPEMDLNSNPPGAVLKVSPSGDLSKVTKEAQHQLESCQTVPDMDFNSNPPGGVWNVSPARDLSKVTKEAQHQLASCQTVPEMDFNSNPPGGVWNVSPARDNAVSQMGKELSVTDLTCLKDQHDLPAELQKQPQKYTGGKHVTFEPELQHAKPCSRLYREPYPTGSSLGFSTDYKATLILRPGVDQEESKKQRGSQYMMYRRLFMDIEREQVKEQQRQQQHQKRIEKIKEEKEKLRKAQEKRMIEHTHQTEFVTESVRTAHLKEEETQKRADQDKSQRNRESTRYIEALRAQMMEKIKLWNTNLPPLCYCGSEFWDSHPDKCANNCVFYKNPKGYAKALQSVLSSCDASDHSSMKKLALMNLCPAKK